MKRGLIFCVVYLLVQSLLGQNGRRIDKQQVAWTRYLMKWEISEQFQFMYLLEERTYLASPLRKHMFISEANLSYRLHPNWRLAHHFTYARFSLPHDPDALVTSTRREVRPQQSITYLKSLSPKLKMAHRLMLEERFMQVRNEEGDFQQFEMTRLRLRLRNRFSYQVSSCVNLTFTNEVMIHGGSEPEFLFDQNRLSGDLNLRINQHFTWQTGYTYWYQIRGDQYFHKRHSWRIALIHKI
jgi:hypothetical protein